MEQGKSFVAAKPRRAFPPTCSVNRFRTNFNSFSFSWYVPQKANCQSHPTSTRSHCWLCAGVWRAMLAAR